MINSMDGHRPKPKPKSGLDFGHFEAYMARLTNHASLINPQAPVGSEFSSSGVPHVIVPHWVTSSTAPTHPYYPEVMQVHQRWCVRGGNACVTSGWCQGNVWHHPDVARTSLVQGGFGTQGFGLGFSLGLSQFANSGPKWALLVCAHPELAGTWKFAGWWSGHL